VVPASRLPSEISTGEDVDDGDALRPEAAARALVVGPAARLA